MDPKLLALHHKIQTDLPFFAQHAPLLIKTKTGKMVPFVLNAAQQHFHERIEEQKRKTGRVRALLMKGRQEGASTYVAARYFHAATRNPGTSVYILSHLASTSARLFDMVKRFQKNVVNELRVPEGACNGYRMTFPSLESDYTVGTAGSDDSGRGGTIQRFHGSEVGYWPNTDEIQTGVMQSVSDEPGTEIILESTGNGPTGMYYELAMNALHGVGDYILLFAPWWWMPEYERDATNFVPTSDETEYARMFFGDLPNYPAMRKLAWMRNKRLELKKDWLFKREYPATPLEAFQFGGRGLVAPELIMQARKSTVRDDMAPIVLGVDPARGGGDRAALVLRQGRVVPFYKTYTEIQPMQLAAIVADWINKFNVTTVFMDAAEGAAIVDRLHEMGYRNVVSVPFNAAASQPHIYRNKRAEMIITAGEWFGLEGGVRIPDDDEFHADVAAMPEYSQTSESIRFMIAKDEIKKNLGGRSPDIFDALALTFAYPVATLSARGTPVRRISSASGGLSSLEAFRRLR